MFSDISRRIKVKYFFFSVPNRIKDNNQRSVFLTFDACNAPLLQKPGS